jgi:hypothetical protein
MSGTGWKITRPDGTTHGGFAWPLVQPGDALRHHVAHDIDYANTSPCPARPGDGFCLARTARGASSGGIGLGDCVGLLVEWDGLLGEDADKMRVERVTVTGTWDVLGVIRAGLAHDLRHADLCDADLSHANLSHASLWYANLSHANLRYASLPHADLPYADVWYANLSHANLSHASLPHADLCDANLWYANLSHADLWGADLCDANLRYANLSHADLRGANLSHASLGNADLSHADLCDANLRRADLCDAKADADTIWPDGFDPVAAGVEMLG